VKKQLLQMMNMDVADVASMPALKRYTAAILRFSWRVTNRFVADRCIQRASALGYASLLAIVPLVVLGFSIFTSFQAFDVVSNHVRSALLEYLLPTSQHVVEDYLGNIADKAGALSAFGIIGLLFTAVALLNTMEEAFNDIWRISRTRPLLSKFIVFWSMLTLSPILIGASISITSYFTALPIIRDVAVGASAIRDIPFLVPWMISTIAMTSLYVALPNTRVPLRHAIVGGMVSAALFECTKIGFAFYITELANYEKIYGALGTLPVFLIWLYLIWIVLLFGAEVTFCLQNPEKSRRQQLWLKRPDIQLFFSYLALIRAAEALQQGKTLKFNSFLEETGLSANIIQEWLDHLGDKHLLQRVIDQEDLNDQDSWALAIDPHLCSMAEIHDILIGKALAIPPEWSDSPIAQALLPLYQTIEQNNTGVLSQVALSSFSHKSDTFRPVKQDQP